MAEITLSALKLCIVVIQSAFAAEFSALFFFLIISLSQVDKIPGRTKRISMIAQKEPIEMVLTIDATVASSNNPPTIVVTMTKIIPEVIMVWIEPSYALTSASFTFRVLRFS